MHENGEPLTRSQLVAWVRDATARFGLEGNYSGHSFRNGAATTAASMGVPDHLINIVHNYYNYYSIIIHSIIIVQYLFNG